MVSHAETWLAAHPDKAGTRPQTVDAQLQHQPTRDSVAKCENETRATISPPLSSNAKAMQSGGRRGGLPHSRSPPSRGCSNPKTCGRACASSQKPAMLHINDLTCRRGDRV